MRQAAHEEAAVSVPPEAMPPGAVPPDAASADEVLAGSVMLIALAASLVAAAAIIRDHGRWLVSSRPRSAVRPPWSGGDVAAVILVYLSCQIVAAEMLIPRPTADGIVWQQIAAGVAASLGTLVITVPYLRARGGSWAWASLGFVSTTPARDVVRGLVMLVAVTPPLLVLAGFLDKIVPYHHPILKFLAENKGPSTMLLVATSAVVVAPLAEEFFFRGVLQGWLARVAPPAAVPVAATAFGLAHLDHGLGWIPLVLFGLAAGYLAVRTGSLLASITLHAGFNAIGLAVAMLQTPG